MNEGMVLFYSVAVWLIGLVIKHFNPKADSKWMLVMVVGMSVLFGIVETIISGQYTIVPSCTGAWECASTYVEWFAKHVTIILGLSQVWYKLFRAVVFKRF